MALNRREFMASAALGAAAASAGFIRGNNDPCPPAWNTERSAICADGFPRAYDFSLGDFDFLYDHQSVYADKQSTVRLVRIGNTPKYASPSFLCTDGGRYRWMCSIDSALDGTIWLEHVSGPNLLPSLS